MKKLKSLFTLISLMLLFVSNINAQGLQGNWDGNLTVNENQKLPFKMVIYTDDNGNCSGQTRLWIEIEGTMYYAQYSFSGTFSGTTFNFHDDELIKHDSPSSSDFYWCKKSGTLYLSDQTLTGNVTGYSPKGACMPAKAYLKYHSAAE